MENRGKNKPYKSPAYRRSHKYRHTTMEGPSMFAPNVENDHIRKQVLSELSEPSRSFLDKPKDDLFMTHLALVKSQFCSPMQNLRLLEKYGFSFKLEFHARSDLGKDFPGGNVGKCWIQICAFRYEQPTKCRGEGKADFVVLANEIAAAEVCKQIEAHYGVKLAPYSIAEVLNVRPDIVQALQQRCKDFLLTPTFEDRVIKYNAAPRKFECEVKAGQDNSVTATAYHPDIAKFLAAKKMYEKMGFSDGTAESCGPSLPEERHQAKYVLILERAMDLRAVANPHVNLIPKELQAILAPKLSDLGGNHQFQIHNSTSGERNKVSSGSVMDIIRGTNVMPNPKSGTNFVNKVPAQMPVDAPRLENIKVTTTGHPIVEEKSENLTYMIEVSSEKTDEKRESETSSVVRPVDCKGAEEKLSPTTSRSVQPIDSGKVEEKPEPIVTPRPEKEKIEVEPRTIGGFQSNSVAAEINADPDDFAETMEGVTETVIEDVTITAKEPVALRNLSSTTNTTNEIFEPTPTPENVELKWYDPGGYTLSWLIGCFLIAYFVFVHLFFLREWFK